MRAEELREARTAESLTQAALADALGVSSNTVARWERGELPVPKWVGRMLDLRAELDRATRALARVKKGAKRKTRK